MPTAALEKRTPAASEFVWVLGVTLQGGHGPRSAGACVGRCAPGSSQAGRARRLAAPGHAVGLFAGRPGRPHAPISFEAG